MKLLKYACENWHYSKCLPIGKTLKVGAWENEKFIGVVIFSHGTAKDLGSKYMLSQNECVELTRVALSKHETSVSRILTISVKFLKKLCPGIKLIVSFADSEKGHHGGIYQACGWLYTGNVEAKYIIYRNGKELPLRSYFEIYKKDRSIKNKCVFKKRTPKYRYLFALSNEIKKQIYHLSKQYPKRASSVESGISEFHSEGGGESPTDALQFSNEVL